NLSHDDADNRQFQNQPVNDMLPVVGLIIGFQAEGDSASENGNQPPVARHKAGNRHYHFGQPRQSFTRSEQAFKDVFECRNDDNHNHRNHDDGDDDDGNRIDQGAFHVALQFDHLFQVGRQALQNDVENTAGFAGGDHVAIEMVEGARMFR